MPTLLAVLLCCLDLTPTRAAPPLLDELRRVARNASVHPTSPWVKAFLAATQQLSPIPRRVFFRDVDRTVYYTEAEARALPAARRKALVRQVVDEETYYARIADPTGYLRPLEVLAAAGFDPTGARLLDFGYGSIGHLLMLAALGADAVGIEVDPLLPKLYADSQGRFGIGKVTTLHGRFPSEDALVRAVGGGYDLFLSKNTLKRGYVHPAAPVDPKHVIDLGGDDRFLRAVHDLLRPRGLVLIYNFGPAPAPPGKPYVQMADIRCPFGRAALERAGFEVLAYDVDDSKEGRVVGKLLEWDRGEGATPLDQLFARYTLLRRRN